MDNFRVWIERVQHEPGVSCARKYGSAQRMMGIWAQGHRSPVEEVPIGQTENNLSMKIKIIMYYNLLNTNP